MDEMPVIYKIDSAKLFILQSFINDCKRSNIELYIVCSPYFIKFKQPVFSIELAKEIARKNEVRFFDYSRDSLFISNPSLFADHAHLNDSGARIFSELLIDAIQN